MLAIPHYGLNYAIDNWSSATPGTTPGTAITMGNSNAMGSVTDLLGTTLAADCYAIEINIVGTTSSGVDTSALVDIVYDPAGGTTWTNLVPSLLAGFAPANHAPTTAKGHRYWFPLFVPKGSTIGARGQTIRAAGTNTFTILVNLWGGPSRPGFWFGTRVTAVGADTANSAGLDHTPGSTGTYSSWTSIGGASDPAFGFVFLGVQGASATHNAIQEHAQVGFGSTQIAGGLRYVQVTAAEAFALHPHSGCFVSVPASTQMQVRATSSSATTDALSYIVYGVS